MLTAEQFKFHLARYAKVKETEANAFMDAVTKTLLENVQAGEEVEIQGLGTFVVIDSQQGRRLGFQVDEKMRKQVNAPFACFEPMVLAAEMKKNVPQPVVEVGTPEPEEEIVNKVEDTPMELASEPAPVVEEPATVHEPEEEEPVQEPEVAVAPASEEPSEPESTPTPEPVSEAAPAPEPVAPKPVRKRYEEPSLVETLQAFWQKARAGEIKPWVWGAAAGGLLVLVLLIWLLIPSGKKSDVAAPIEEEKVVAAVDSTDVAAEDESVAEDEPVKTQTSTESKSAPAKVEQPKTVASPVSTKGKKPSDEMLLHENGSPKMASLGDGGRLTLVALRNYGDKAFWAYIYDVNSFQLGNPNNVPIGLPLYLPDPTYYQIDASDPASIKRAQNRAMQILNEWK